MSYQFQGQRPHEDVLLVTHQHPFVLLHPILIATALLFVPVLMVALVGTGWVVSISFVFALLAILKIWISWYGWRRTLFLVTNERIVFLEQKGFFERDLVEAPLRSIQQVAHNVSGILRTVAGYGNLSLSTSSSLQPLMIPSIPDPYAIQQEIVRAQSGEGMEDQAE